MGFFPAAVEQSGGKWELQLGLAHACPSSFAHNRSSRKSKVADDELSDRDCEIAPVPASFKSDVWNPFGKEKR